MKFPIISYNNSDLKNKRTEHEYYARVQKFI